MRYVVRYAAGTRTKEFATEAEAEKYLDEHNAQGGEGWIEDLGDDPLGDWHGRNE
jgi:hypothetical protein